MIVSTLELVRGRSVRQGPEGLTDLGDPRGPASAVSPSRPLFVRDLEGGPDTVNSRVIPDLCRGRRWWIGGGAPTVGDAKRWLGDGAEQVVVPARTAAPILEALPPGTVVVDLTDDADPLGAVGALCLRAGGFRVRYGGDLDALGALMRAARGTAVCAMDIPDLDTLKRVHAMGLDVELPLQGGPVDHQAALQALTPPPDASLPFDDEPADLGDPFETVTVSFLAAEETGG